jgi:peptidoglycan lytic transglycosylase A
MRRLLLPILLALIVFAPLATAQAPTPRDDGDARSLLLTLDRQERYLQKSRRPTLRIGQRTVTKARMIQTVRELRKLVLAKHGRPDFGAELARRFEIVTVADNALFTAYHSPLLPVSRERSPDYSVPILGRPPDLVEKGGKVYRRAGGNLVPPPTRAEIMAGAYNAAKLAVAWTKNSVQFYYTQIQGSAVAKFPDGTSRTLLYAGNNGHGYVSVENNILRAVPAAKRPGGYLGLRRYLRAHPDVAQKFFRKNPRFIFFRLSDQPPAGMTGLPLTAKRSIATDKRYYSAGLIALVSFPEPRTGPGGQTETHLVQYLVADADTGAAIKGPARVDVYFGEGSVEELFAAGIKDKGTLAYLILRQ